MLQIVALALRALQVPLSPLLNVPFTNHPLRRVPPQLTLAQLIFAAIILGLSITLIKGQVYGSAPSQTDFSAFVGGWTALTAVAGILAATFLTFLDGIMMLALDGLSVIFTLAAGIVRPPALHPVLAPAD